MESVTSGNELPDKTCNIAVNPQSEKIMSLVIVTAMGQTWPMRGVMEINICTSRKVKYILKVNSEE